MTPRKLCITLGIFPGQVLHGVGVGSVGEYATEPGNSWLIVIGYQSRQNKRGIASSWP
jgi:hypothetical protein